MSTLIWSDTSISECPGCGRTCVVGICSLAVTCPIDGFYYVDVDEKVKAWGGKSMRGWYSSRAAYERGEARI